MKPRFEIVHLLSTDEWIVIRRATMAEYLKTPYKDRAEYLCELLNQQPMDDIV